MQVIATDKQKSDKLRETASPSSSDNSDTEALLANAPSRSDTEDETQKAASTSSDQEAWWQQPKQECLR